MYKAFAHHCFWAPPSPQHQHQLHQTARLRSGEKRKNGFWCVCVTWCAVKVTLDITCGSGTLIRVGLTTTHFSMCECRKSMQWICGRIKLYKIIKIIDIYHHYHRNVYVETITLRIPIATYWKRFHTCGKNSDIPIKRKQQTLSQQYTRNWIQSRVTHIWLNLAANFRLILFNILLISYLHPSHADFQLFFLCFAQQMLVYLLLLFIIFYAYKKNTFDSSMWFTCMRAKWIGRKPFQTNSFPTISSESNWRKKNTLLIDPIPVYIYSKTKRRHMQTRHFFHHLRTMGAYSVSAVANTELELKAQKAPLAIIYLLEYSLRTENW